MPDRGKVIERLGKVSYYFKSLLAVGWQGDANIYREHMESVNMAIAMLKEQEPMMVRLTASTIRCPKCGKQITSRGAIHREIKFCWKCGQAVKWE